MDRLSKTVRSQKAFALVVTLSMVVIISVILIAFLSVMQKDRQASQSYSQGIRAEQIAQGAFQQIESQLLDEIAFGSIRYGANGTETNSDAPYIYQPKNASNMRIEPSGVSNAGPLVKISRDGALFYPGGIPLASAAHSTTASANGRRFPLSRWNKPKFFQDWPSDLPAPDWILATRQGPKIVTAAQASNSTLSNTDFVLGRYAYAIYDVSGLLDITAAGYPSSGSDLTTDYISGKNSLALADLTQIPNGEGSTLTQAQINSLCQWRNKASLPAYQNHLTGFVAATGGLEVFPGDNSFINRQDLIRYASDHDMSGSLPYFTTFHRSVNLPSWSPSKNSDALPNYQGGAGSTVFNYKANENDSTVANRNAANIRCLAAPGTYTHYHGDGTTTSFTLNVGAPLFQHRFSLKKLSWLGKDGPNASAFDPSLTAAQRNAAIRACFGLVWNSATKCWDYDALDGSNKIYTLQGLDSAQAGLSFKREPNFFELLKAGILEGSLARGAGGPNLAGASPYGPGQDVDGISSSDPGAVETHLFRIGANIIDQYDADSYPTTLYTGLYPAGSPYGLACGMEDLPYFYRSVQGAIDTTPPTFTDGVDNNDMLCWFRPVLWNPHQKGPAVPGPARLRIQAYGVARGSVVAAMWDAAQGKTVGKDLGAATARWSTAITLGNAAFPAGAEDAWITFSANQDFRTAPDSPKGSFVDTNDTPPANIPWFPSDPTPSDPSFPHQWATFSMPKVRYDPDSHSLDPAPSAGVLGRTTYATGPSNSGYVSYALQWEDPDMPGFWRTYAVYPKFGKPANISHASTYRQPHFIPGVRLGTANGLDNFAVVDPRTSRFGASLSTLPGSGGLPHQSTVRAGSSSPSGIDGYRFDQHRPWDTSGFFYPAADGARSYPATLMQNRIDSRMHYRHKDGVVRGGDGYYASTNSATYAGTLPNGVSTILDSGPAYTEGSQRPLILNRPFRSVGELGYAFRDEPFKTLDFFTDASADTALLDLFCIDEAPLSAGKFNPVTAPVPVLQSLLKGAVKKEAASSAGFLPISTQSPTIAAHLQTHLNAAPVTNRGDLIAPISAAMTAAASSLSDNALTMNKTQREAPVRALIESANVRTWNLMIDVVAQSGRYSSGTATLDEGFVVEGEKRYWMHIAIDRFTGKVVGRHLEPVYE